MQNEKNWHRIYFNRQIEGAKPDMPARLNVNLVSVEQLHSTVALQLEYTNTPNWRSSNWYLAAPAELARGLELACCELGSDLRKILNGLGMSTTPLEFTYQSGSRYLTFRWSTKVSGHFWTAEQLSNSGMSEIAALRLALVWLLKIKISLARALGLPDTVRADDILQRIMSSVSKREGQRFGRSEALGLEHGAFFGDRLLRDRTIAQVRAHREAGQLVRGNLVWSGDFGSAAGCTLHSEDFRDYSSELSIPALLGRLQETFFQVLPSEADAQLWPERFLTAIRPGADLSKIWSAFLVWMLTDPSNGLVAYVQEEHLSYSPKLVLSTVQHDAIEVLAGMFRDHQAAQWQFAASNAATVVRGLANRWTGVPTCIQRVAEAIVSSDGVREDSVPLRAVSTIITLIVETIAVCREIRCGKDGPDSKEFYPQLYKAAVDKLIEMLEAAPVAMPPA